MTFRLSWERRPNAVGLDDRVAVLAGHDSRLEVWPALGFTAYRWAVGGAELFYTAPTFFEEKRPTRTGLPILFPFPNRIRDGRYSWDGRDYQLPLADPAKKNAIHGFACHAPWRIVGEGADADSAWLTGEFHASRDAPHALDLWPADHRLRLTYRLLHHSLRVEAVVDNPDAKPLPFGLGYHPYFRVAPFGGPQALVTIAARKAWPLSENLPTGEPHPIDSTAGRPFADLKLDDALTDLHPLRVEDDLALIGQVQAPAGGPSLDLWAARDFRELVAFTPPHREAVCLEPYTCTTDAINLQQQGVDAGLRVLQPGDHWQGDVEIIYKASHA